MTYKDAIAAAITECAKDPLFRVVGYNVCAEGGAGGGTFAGVPEGQRIEMPLAEGICASVAIGMSLGGFKPLLWIERADFVFHALDAIVNHLDKLALLSNGMHRPACIVRMAVGKKRTPLFTEPTHTQDLTVALRDMLGCRVVQLKWTSSIQSEYRKAMADLNEHRSTVLVEYRDLDSDT